MPTPEWWLEHLTAQLDLRRARTAVLRSYLTGNAPLPEGAEGCREAYEAFQRKARRNYAAKITSSVTDRMEFGGFRVGDATEDDDEARQIWVANRLGVWSTDVHSDMVGLANGYVCVQLDEDGFPEITYQSPDLTITSHDPSRPDKVRGGLIVFRDDVMGLDSAYLHVPGEVFKYFREVPKALNGRAQPFTRVSGGWKLVDQGGTGEATGLETVPIIPFVNRAGLGEFEIHTDLLDCLNWNVLQRLVIVAIHAYRQRAVKGELPEAAEDGSPIDYGELFKPGPGALWQLPEGVEIWESAQSDLAGILEADKADLRSLAAVTDTPMSALVPDGANQSAEGAAFAREGLVFKTKDRIARAAASWAEAMRLALALKRGSESAVPEVAAYFLPPDHPSMAERYDALSKAGTDVPWRTKMTHILGFDGDEVDRMEADRADDMLQAAAMAPPPPVVTNQPMAPPTAVTEPPPVNDAKAA